MSRPGSPFSNGTEYDAWASGWCHWPCRHEPNCEILIKAFTDTDRTPDEWVSVAPRAFGSGRYACTKFLPLSREGDGRVE